MKNQRILISVLILIVFTIQIYSLRANSNSTNQAELDVILEKCADYCERLSHLVLYFVCQEEVTERISNYDPVAIGHFSKADPKRIKKKDQDPPFEKYVYIYDYQLIRKENKTRERRILLKANGQEKNEQDALLKTRRFKHIYMIFGPMGLLSKYHQQLHDYKLVKKTRFKGEEAFVIEATPKLNVKLDKLFGKIWVRKSDFSVLKIEWNQTSVGNYKKIEEYARKLNAIPQITFITEYAFEKNGIRFPSKYSLKEEYTNTSWGKFRKSEITVLYKDYKFFTVETEVK